MKNSQGVGLTVQEQAALAGATQATNAPVPRPFGTDRVSGYDYGQKPEDLYLVVLAQRRHTAQIAKNPARARRG
jgi:hypothetical protein